MNAIWSKVRVVSRLSGPSVAYIPVNCVGPENIPAIGSIGVEVAVSSFSFSGTSGFTTGFGSGFMGASSSTGASSTSGGVSSPVEGVEVADEAGAVDVAGAAGEGSFLGGVEEEVG